MTDGHGVEGLTFEAVSGFVAASVTSPPSNLDTWVISQVLRAIEAPLASTRIARAM